MHTMHCSGVHWSPTLLLQTQNPGCCPDCTVTQSTTTLQTRELLRIAEEEEEEAAAKPSAVGSRIANDTPQQQWDCESVLSLRSNLDNHPGTISEQSSRRYKPASGKIKLAAKTGEQRTHAAFWNAHLTLMGATISPVDPC